MNRLPHQTRQRHPHHTSCFKENRHDRPMFHLPARSDPDAGQYRAYHMAMRLRLWRGISQRQEQKRCRGQLEYAATIRTDHRRKREMKWHATEPSKSMQRKPATRKVRSGRRFHAGCGWKDGSGKRHQMEPLSSTRKDITNGWKTETVWP